MPSVRLPLVANGDIWTVADALRCREVSGCHSLMLGRGIVVDPGLARGILAATRPPAAQSDEAASAEVSWEMLQPLIADFWHIVCASLDRRQQAGRLKQWLNFLRRRHPQAEIAFTAVRTLDDPVAVTQWLLAHGVPVTNMAVVGKQ